MHTWPKKSRKALTPLKWYLLFLISFLNLLSAMGIYELSSKTEEIQETTMTDALEKTFHERDYRIHTIFFYQWLRLSVGTPTKSPKLGAGGVVLVPSWQPVFRINTAFHRTATLNS